MLWWKNLGLLLLAMLSACPGSADPIDPGRNDAAPKDIRGVNEATVEPDTKPPPLGCSAEGIAQACDPLTNSGCSEGDCYVVRDKGAACVCPAGTAALDAECESSIACEPKHVCFREDEGDPAVCHPTCDPSVAEEDTGCPASLPGCRPIEGYAEFGFCKKWPP